MKWALRIALFCALAPLLLGTTVLAVWLATRLEWLGVAGLLVIYGGVILSVIGAIALGRYGWSAWRGEAGPRRRSFVKAAAVGFLLLLNYPVAAVYVQVATNLLSRVTVVVDNRSGTALTGVRLVVGPAVERLGALAPAEVRTHHFWPRNEGSLLLWADRPGGVVQGEVAGYVAVGFGGSYRVTVGPGGGLTVVRDPF